MSKQFEAKDVHVADYPKEKVQSCVLCGKVLIDRSGENVPANDYTPRYKRFFDVGATVEKTDSGVCGVSPEVCKITLCNEKE
jgi:hypothetical protein